MFKMAFQSVINRYYFALRNMVNFKKSSETRNLIWIQIRIMKPFVSKNVFRVKPEDILIYNSNEFLIRLIDHLSTHGVEGRYDSYCILQLLRGDYKPVKVLSTTNFRLLNCEITSKKYNEEPLHYILGEFDGGYREVSLTDRELASLSDPTVVNEDVNKLIQIVKQINDEYINNSGNLWDNQIEGRLLFPSRPSKIQCWSYFLYDEMSRINQYSEEELMKEQTCFHKLIYNNVDYERPNKIEINRVLLFHFFNLIKRNRCHDQNGFYQKIYTVNKIIDNADIEDVKLMSKIKHWEQIDWYKERIEAIDDMINFLEPILNSNYINEEAISIVNLKEMIKSILRDNRFLAITTYKKPKQLLNDIEGKKGIAYNCNIALLFNILGALYRHVVNFLKGSPCLLKQTATNAFNQLVLPYGIEGDKNNNKFLTRYDRINTPYSVISKKMEDFIVEEMKNRKYYK